MPQLSKPKVTILPPVVEGVHPTFVKYFNKNRRRVRSCPHCRKEHERVPIYFCVECKRTVCRSMTYVFNNGVIRHVSPDGQTCGEVISVRRNTRSKIVPSVG